MTADAYCKHGLHNAQFCLLCSVPSDIADAAIAQATREQGLRHAVIEAAKAMQLAKAAMPSGHPPAPGQHKAMLACVVAFEAAVEALRAAERGE